MKAISFRLFVFLAILVLYGCGNGENHTRKSFPRSKRLTAVKIQYEQIIDVFNICIANDHLILLASPKTDTVCYVYSLPDFQFVTSFGIYGQGPDEFSHTVLLVQNNTNRLYLNGVSSDMHLVREHLINPHDRDNTPKKIHINNNIDVFQWHIIDDSVLFYVEKTDKIYLHSVNLHTNTLLHTRALDLIKRRPQESSEESMLYYTNVGILSANGVSTAYSYRNKDRIDFMYHNFSIKKTITGGAKMPPLEEDADKNISYYKDVFVGKDKFYFLYQGDSKENMRRTGKTKSIEVYDNDGVPLIVYQPDTNFYGFVVDEKRNRIYAHGEEDGIILVFDMERN